MHAAPAAGMSLPTRSAYKVDRSGTPYMYQQYGLVDSISPAAGSLQGREQQMKEAALE
jgi:hypothetical protein